MMEQELKERMNKAIQELTDIISEIQIRELQNEQESLNFVDEINRLSVSF